jgi:hypothetical protein
MIPQIATDPIELSVTNGVPVTIRHGLGRQVAGWIVVWASATINFYASNPLADTRAELVLVPTGTGNVRLVLL